MQRAGGITGKQKAAQLLFQANQSVGDRTASMRLSRILSG
jgi:hypothetical protein